MNRPFSLLTTISLILNFFFVIYLVMDYGGKLDEILADEPVAAEETIDPIAQIKETVVERERAKLPLTTQEYSGVRSIRIDSLVLTKTTSPYEGYLVTTWDFEQRNVRKKKTVYVEINYLHHSSYNDETTWNADWMGAYFSLD